MFKRVLLFTMLAAVPTSTNYTLKTYDFGNGANTGSSTNYTVQGTAGARGGTLASSTYQLPPGVHASQNAAVPVAPTFTNPDNSYNRLTLIINTTGQASDVKYAVAISSDGFATTKYVQTDNTVGTTFGVAQYQTYAAWGSASGVVVTGLTPSTTYAVKVAALQGSGTGSAFGPTASAATSTASVTFGVSTSLTSTPPFSSAFTNMTAGSVASGSATVNTSLTANAENGGAIMIKDANGGLTSSTKSSTLASATADLGVATKGYGAQISSTSQTSGGPIVALSPYSGTGNSVGALTANWQNLASFAAPVNTGALSFALKAKVDTITPAAPDYADTITLSISLLF